MTDELGTDWTRPIFIWYCPQTAEIAPPNVKVVANTLPVASATVPAKLAVRVWITMPAMEANLHRVPRIRCSVFVNFSQRPNTDLSAFHVVVVLTDLRELHDLGIVLVCDASESIEATTDKLIEVRLDCRP